MSSWAIYLTRRIIYIVAYDLILHLSSFDRRAYANPASLASEENIESLFISNCSGVSNSATCRIGISVNQCVIKRWKSKTHLPRTHNQHPIRIDDCVQSMSVRTKKNTVSYGPWMNVDMAHASARICVGRVIQEPTYAIVKIVTSLNAGPRIISWIALSWGKS